MCKTRPRNRFVREFTGLRSRSKAALLWQSLARYDGSTLLTKELQKLVHEPYDSCKREPDTISLVIPDLMMLKMGGQECPEEILKIDPKAKVPIATAVSVDDERTELAIKLGAKGIHT